MKPSRSASLTCLLTAQTQVVFNDNAAKLMLIGLAQMLLTDEQATQVVSSLAVLLVLPFVLFAPVAGWVADRFPKRNVLMWLLLFQIMVMGWIFWSLQNRSMIGAIVGFGLLALQACMFSPSKQGILKELVGSERLGVAVGWMEMLTIIAILLGSFAGGKLFDEWTRSSGNPWRGALMTTALLAALSLLALGIFQGVGRTQSQSKEPFRINLLWQHFSQAAELWRNKNLRLAALGVAYFYSFGGVLYLILVQLGRRLHEGQIGAATETGIMLGILGLGIAAGSLFAASLCRHRIELGLVPVGGLGLTLALFVVGISPAKSWSFNAGLVAFGIFAGLFVVPLNAFLQDKADPSRRGRILAATNLLLNLGGVFAVFLQYGLSNGLHMEAPQQFLIMTLPSFAVALYVVWLLPESLFRLSLLIIARCLYRIRVFGADRLPKGGALLICNHVSYIDALILQAACPRPVRFIAYEAFHRKWYLGWILKILGVIPISSKHARDAIRVAAQKLKEGELVCVFPEGQLTRTGNLLGFRKGFELMARQGGVPVVPVFLDSLWGSIFSFSENRYFWKFPRQLPYSAFVNFGHPIPFEKVDAPMARQNLLDLGEEVFEQHPDLREHLGHACLRALCRRPWKSLMVDQVPQRRELSRGLLLSLGIVLASRWRSRMTGSRIGIILPPGIGGTVANLAVVLLGKIPVNLNFTMGRAAMESCLRRGEIQVVVSADAMKKRLPDLPWPEQTLDVAQEIRACSRASLLGWLAAVWCLPGGWIARMLNVPSKGDDQEAALLFTSGSSGEPKGVVLTHRNILGNVAQVAAMDLMHRRDTLLACLPLFHSFGFTVTLWYPLLKGVRVVTVPSPLEVKKIAESIYEERATVFLSTPTFLRPYLRKAEPQQLRSLRLVVTGAEKLPLDLAQAFKERFNLDIYEGYGLTETSPVASVNLPDPPIPTSTAEYQPAHRLGSVGRLIPGMTARIVDPETGVEKSPLEIGMLHLRGPNVFNGYLNDPDRTRQVLRNHWFVTGDLARFDEDGFLFIEGRLSRFSKIGGEMVPHGTVEQKIIQVFGLESMEVQPLAVTGIPDPSKGESLVLLTTVDISAEELRRKLTEAGLPNLWIPKMVRKIEKVPVLASGKLDLKAFEALAKANEESR